MLEVILFVLPQQAVSPEKVLPIKLNRVEQAVLKKPASRSAKPTLITSEAGSIQHLAQVVTQSVEQAQISADAVSHPPDPTAPETTKPNTNKSAQVMPEWAIVRTEMTPRSTPQSAVAPTTHQSPGATSLPVSTSQPSPANPKADVDTLQQQGPEAAKTERLKLIEQKLAEIVAREKPIKEERLRQNLKAAALKKAQAGQLAAARQTANDLVLSLEEQKDLLQQIQVIETDRSKLVAKQLVVSNRPSSGKPKAGRYPILPEQISAISPSVLGSGLRLWKGRWQLGNGNLRLVFPLPIAAPFTSGFGWRVHPISGESRFHRGVDMGAPIGTPVVATFSGTVTLADYAGGYGLTVMLSHNNDTQQTLYAHLSEIFVRPGEKVEQGMVIGRVGDTGLSTGPHLHFEFHQLTTAGWEVLDPAAQLEVALAQLTNGFMVSQNLDQAEILSDDFAAIPPPPTMKRAIVHNF
jgi:murein DD-endopeptidase MepM/ murein hydrolase activator NlpD